MSNSKLPKRASLEFLRKLAKDRLRALRKTDPEAKLATALLAVARDHGFSSWRQLKAAVEERQQDDVTRFFVACAGGDVEILRGMLAGDARLAHVERPGAPGWTGLHEAAKAGHAGAVRLLLEHGADPNAREAGDNTYPLHWAAARADREIATVLLDAGGDVHGLGDVHEIDTIGWASIYHGPHEDPIHMTNARNAFVSFLCDRGARHHIFSALAVGDRTLIRGLVEENPAALDRRMSRFERRMTPLHFAMSRKRHDLVDLLIELGADVEAEDAGGQTPLAVAMLKRDDQAMRSLHAAGALEPKGLSVSDLKTGLQEMARSIKKGVPMIMVPDVARALDWYTSIGFTEIARYGEDGLVNFGMLSLGQAELMLNMHGNAGRHDVSLWFYTDEVDRVYQLFKSRQLAAAQAALAGKADAPEGIEIQQDIEDMFYGARQFCIRDLNGYELYFIQSTEA